MEIVIKIPDKMYEDAKGGKDIGESRYITQVIKQGTPYNSSGDCISRSDLKETIIEPLNVNDAAKNDWYEGYYTAKNEDVMAIDNAQTVPERDYRQGWHDAITKALNEAYTITSEDGSFKVVQTETLEGLGMSMPMPERPQGDLISREALRKEFKKRCHAAETVDELSNAVEDLEDLIDNAPSVSLPNEQIISDIPKDYLYDTETTDFYVYRNKYTGKEIHIVKNPPSYILDKRPQGEWVDDRCSVCHCEPLRKFTEPAGLDGGSWISTPMKYCPNCGAKMKGGKEE